MRWLRLQQALLGRRTIGERVLWLVRLRWLAALGVLTIGLGTYYLTPVRFSLGCVFGIALFVMLYNIPLYYWMGREVRDKMPEEAASGSRYGIHLQIVADLVCLTVLIQCTGGVINPFLIFMVFHMAIAGIMLPRADAFLQAGVASILLGVMALLDMYVPGSRGQLAGYPLETDIGGYPLAAHPLYVGTVWLALAVTFFLTVYFTSGISRQLANAYRDLAAAYEELHNREAAKSQFLRVVAHEMRSPLAATISLVELLNSEEPADTVTQQVHGRIKARCEAMMDMVDDLLRLAHVRAGGELVGRPEPFDLAQVIRATCAEFDEEAADKGVQLVVDVTDAAGIAVVAVRRDLRDLIANLVGNAIKYTATGGRVDVVACKQDSRALLRVADTGIGIPAGEQERVFTEFFRASNARRVTAHSSGLGLSIVKSIVEKLSGQLRFQSEEGRGTTFEVLLPAVPAAPAETGKSSQRQ